VEANNFGLSCFVPPHPDIYGTAKAHALKCYSPATYNPSRHKYATGTAELVVLLIEFEDVKHAEEHTSAYYDDVLFAPGAGKISLHNYYAENSLNKLLITGTICAVWYCSEYTMAYYGEDSTDGVDDANGPIYKLVTEAVNLADQELDFSMFDSDQDGMVDHVLVIHAGEGQEVCGESAAIYSHFWYNYDEPEVDGVRIGWYMMVSEYSTLGVIAHEFGHNLGLIDLYDIDLDSEGVGVWCLMGTGCWLPGDDNEAPGSRPSHLSVWCKMKLGWITPVRITAPESNIELRQIETEPDAYILWVGQPESSQEFFLLENRMQTGYDASLPGSGLLIWHVDESRADNRDQSHRLVDLEEADEAVNGDSPYQATDPWVNNISGFSEESIPNSNSYRGIRTGWSVTHISAPGPVMTLTIGLIENDVSVDAVRAPRIAETNTNVEIHVSISNYGTITQYEFKAECVINLAADGGVRIFNKSQMVMELAPWSSTELIWVWVPELSGSYIITVTTTLLHDEIPENDWKEVIVRVTTILWDDNMEYPEGQTGGWETYTNYDPPFDITEDIMPESIWHVVSTNEHDEDYSEYADAQSGHQSWWCGYETTGYYRRFTRYYLEREIDLGQATEAVLIFSHRYDIQSGLVFQVLSDYAYVEVSTNLGLEGTWETVAEYVGSIADWETVYIDLTPYLERILLLEKRIWLRFHLYSNLLLLGRGWYIDDIIIIGEAMEHRVMVECTTDTSKSTYPNQTVEYTFKITNVGNTADTYELIAEHVPEYWYTEFSSDQITLQIHQTGEVKFSVKPHSYAIATTTAEIDIYVNSIGDPAVRVRTVVTITIKQVYGIKFSTEVYTVDAEPGTNRSCTINIINLGNGLDIVTLSVAGGNHAVTGTLNLTAVKLIPFGTANVTLYVSIHPKARPGNISITIRGESASPMDIVTAHTQLIVTVGRLYSISVECYKYEQACMPGVPITFQIVVINKGNDNDTVTLSGDWPSGWIFELDATRIELGYDETKAVLLTVVPDTRAFIGVYEIIVCGVAGDGITAASATMKIKIIRPDLTVSEIRVSVQEPIENEPIVFTVTVTNIGSAPAPAFKVVFYTDSSELGVAQVYDTLAANESVEVSVTAALESGSHRISAKVLIIDLHEAIAETAVDNNLSPILILNVRSKITADLWSAIGVLTGIIVIVIGLLLFAIIVRHKRGGRGSGGDE
jgi:immune inhibitor A